MSDEEQKFYNIDSWMQNLGNFILWNWHVGVKKVRLIVDIKLLVPIIIFPSEDIYNKKYCFI